MKEIRILKRSIPVVVFGQHHIGATQVAKSWKVAESWKIDSTRCILINGPQDKIKLRGISLFQGLHVSSTYPEIVWID